MKYEQPDFYPFVPLTAKASDECRSLAVVHINSPLWDAWQTNANLTALAAHVVYWLHRNPPTEGNMVFHEPVFGWGNDVFGMPKIHRLFFTDAHQAAQFNEALKTFPNDRYLVKGIDSIQPGQNLQLAGMVGYSLGDLVRPPLLGLWIWFRDNCVGDLLKSREHLFFTHHDDLVLFLMGKDAIDTTFSGQVGIPKK